MPTLVLPPRYTPDTIAVGRAASVAGWTVERLPSWRVPDWMRGQDVVLYGEPLFVAVVADELDVALLEPPFDWLPRLPDRYRRRAVRLASLGDARQLRSSAFVKPADHKCFSPRVIDTGACLPGNEVLPAETPVLIAEPVWWEVEFRCFILDRQVATISVYLRDGELAQAPDGTWADDHTEAARDYAQAVCADNSVSLPPAVVVDIGLIEGRGWAVVEANAAWGSGIYGCDPDAVLRVIRRACVPRIGVSKADRRWVSERPAG